MNLLYISNLSNNVDAGLNWSVPASVTSQQRYDNVLWIDITKGAFQEHWREVNAYHNLNEYGEKLSLSILPAPFNNPDCVVFEGFYYIDHVIFAKELKKNRIPYIIIPRGSFTKSAFYNGGFMKRIKKRVAHLLIFDNYVRNSCAIQYLTLEEKKESEYKYKLNSYILPNGMNTPQLTKSSFSDGIKGVFIGRQDIYQKGLDLLLEAIRDIGDELRAAEFTLDIYGPPRYDVKKVTEMIYKLNLSDIVINHETGVRGRAKEEVLLQSDVFFLTSRFEGHPMGLIEALSYGLPSFITRGANMYDEVKKHKTGWVSEISKDSIIVSLRRMLKEKSLFPQYGKNAKELANTYDWDSLAARFHEIVENIIRR
jgi:glycosyltransferase involved in cell wall biosynthesis